MAVVESPFNFFKVERKEVFLNTTIGIEPMFGVAPESL